MVHRKNEVWTGFLTSPIKYLKFSSSMKVKVCSVPAANKINKLASLKVYFYLFVNVEVVKVQYVPTWQF